MKYKLGIIDADLLDGGTKHPNLALMKISGYYKSKGYDVDLLLNYNCLQDYHHIFIGKVFDFSDCPIEVGAYPHITIGGTGFYPDGGNDLPSTIEHHMPDYDLYSDYVQGQLDKGHKKNRYKDYINYSIGFTTRGCFRKCKFCVNQKYDKISRHSPVEEFLDPDKPFIYLWDDNFLGFKDWEDILDTLEATNKPYKFRQGLDIRLMSDKQCIRLANSNYHGDFIFAFDDLKDRAIIERKLKLWRSNTNRHTRLYVLTGFSDPGLHDIANTFKRIEILMQYGCLPYIMRHKDHLNSEYKGIYTLIARWCNQPNLFKKMSLLEMAERDQEDIKTPGFVGSSMRAINLLKSDAPDLFSYFAHLHYEDVNQY